MIVLTIPLLAGTLNHSLYPVLSRASGLDDPELVRVFRRTWTLLLRVGAGSAAILTVLAAGIVGLVYGSGFDASANVLIALAWVLPLRFVNSLCGVTLNASDRQAARMLGVSAAAGFNLVANLALIPLIGYQGAIWSTLVTEALLTGVLLWALRPLRPAFVGSGVMATLTAAAAGGAAIVVPGHVVVRGAVACLIVAAAAAAALRREPAARTVPSVVAVGPIDVIIEGADGADARLRSWMASSLGPLAASPRESAPSITIRFVDGLGNGTGGFSHLPLRPGPDGLWAVDHLGRSALLRPADVSEPTLVDANMDPWFFQRWIFVPLVRAAMWRAGTCMVRAAGVSIDGRRVAIAGWERTGKTRVLLRLLGSGADLLGDDWLSLAPDGNVAPVAAQIALRDVHRRDVPRWPGHRVSLRRLVARSLRGAAGLTSGSPIVSMALARAAEWAWKAGTLKVALADIYPGASVGDPGTLDTLVVLVRPGTQAPSETDIAELLAAQAEVELGHCIDLEATYRYAFPGTLSTPLFGRTDEERELLAMALSGVRVVTVACSGDDADVTSAAQTITRLARRTCLHLQRTA